MQENFNFALAHVFFITVGRSVCEGYWEEKQGKGGRMRHEKGKLTMTDVIRDSQKGQLCVFASLLKIQALKFAPVGVDAKFECV